MGGTKVRFTSQERHAYTLVLPYLVCVVLFVGYLLTSNVISSFVKDGGSFTFEHYQRMLHDPVLPKLLGNTVLWVLGSVVGQFVLGFSIALLLQKVTRAQVFFRSVIFIVPWATLDIVAALTWKWMYNDLYGVVNDVLLRLGVVREPVSWLGAPDLALVAVVLANIWKGFSLSGIFLLARLQTIPRELYESAHIDGAGSLAGFIHITIPQVRAVALSTLLLMVIWTINYFPLIFILTKGGPNFATETLVTYIYRIRFRFLDSGLSSAFSNMLFLIILGIAFVFISKITKEEKA